MTARADERRAALDVLVGEWTVDVDIDGAPTGTYVFEWALDRTYLLERATLRHPAAPDALMVIAYDEDGDEYIQHYFDSRGVTRIYRMDLAEGVWTLERTTPDFAPLGFAQRFVGTISPDANRIDARWEISSDGGVMWDLDFSLTFTRVR